MFISKQYIKLGIVKKGKGESIDLVWKEPNSVTIQGVFKTHLSKGGVWIIKSNVKNVACVKVNGKIHQDFKKHENSYTDWKPLSKWGYAWRRTSPNQYVRDRAMPACSLSVNVCHCTCNFPWQIKSDLCQEPQEWCPIQLIRIKILFIWLRNNSYSLYFGIRVSPVSLRRGIFTLLSSNIHINIFIKQPWASNWELSKAFLCLMFKDNYIKETVFTNLNSH